MENNGKKTVAFLFGAGAERDLGLPSGSEFKKDIVLCTKAREFYQYINDDKEKLKVSNGFILSWNSYHTLYQTMMEREDAFRNALKKDNDEWKKDYNDEWKVYTDYRNLNSCKKNEDVTANKEDITNAFLQFYRGKIYEPLRNKTQLNGSSFKDTFLENVSLCHFTDSRFGSMRSPNRYPNEVAKVMRVLNSAYYSILKNLTKGTYKGFEYKGDDIFEKIFTSDGKSVNERREMLYDYLNYIQKCICDVYKDDSSKKDVYYKMVLDVKDSFDVSVITTNYTILAQKFLELEDEKIAYIHGRLDYFESLEKKIVKPLNEFRDEEIVFPFLFVPSGVKPVVCSWQIEQYAKACKSINDSDYLITIGYGFNDDDEHVVNFFRERMEKKSENTLFFIYDKDEESIKNEKEKLIYYFRGRCRIFGTSNFRDVLNAMKEGKDFSAYQIKN